MVQEYGCIYIRKPQRFEYPCQETKTGRTYCKLGESKSISAARRNSCCCLCYPIFGEINRPIPFCLAVMQQRIIACRGHRFLCHQKSCVRHSAAPADAPQAIGAVLFFTKSEVFPYNQQPGHRTGSAGASPRPTHVNAKILPMKST